MAAGLVLQGILYGWKGLLLSVGGGLLFGGVFLLFYMVRAMGAGDVKLAAALGCIVGVSATFPVMLATALAGGRTGHLFHGAVRPSCRDVAEHIVGDGISCPARIAGTPRRELG
jgi:prepilin peptidase CpaA